MKILKWGIFGLCAAFLAWRMVAVNLSDYSLKQGGSDAATTALAWAPDNPSAMLDKVYNVADSEPDQAERMLVRAIRYQPVDGRMFAALGLLLEQRGEIEKATQAMDYADRLAPARSSVQMDLAGFWGRRQNLDRYLTHLVRVLGLRQGYRLRNPDRERIRNELYDSILAQADNPKALVVVRKVLSQALVHEQPFWWAEFFDYAVLRAKSLDTVRLLYNIRSQSSVAPSSGERIAFQRRLEKEGKWVEAYFVWLNSLGQGRLELLSNLFNGGFESPVSNEGFGWRFHSRKGVEADTVGTQGVTDSKALRVTFSNHLANEGIVSQYLLLPSGRYEINGRVRTDALRADHGVSWRVRCESGAKQHLGESEAFNGSEQWRGFSSRFEVPEDNCRVQQLILALSEPSEEVLGVRGTLWFDDLVMRNVE